MDVQLFYLLNNLAGQSGTFDSVVIFLTEYFPHLVIVSFLLLLFFSGYAKQQKLRIFWVTSLSAVIARFGITELIRFFYHRPRPFMTHETHRLFAENSWSFPSGHSAFFFAIAAALYFYNKKWGIGFFLAALLMNISRVIAGVHYPTDILGGALVGITVAYIMFHFAQTPKTHDV